MRHRADLQVAQQRRHGGLVRALAGRIGLVEHADENGVEHDPRDGCRGDREVAKSLISAWVAPRNVMISNDEVARFVGEYPERLVGIGSVDIARPMAAVAEIRRCVEELGFKGIRVLPWLWEKPPTDRLFYPVYTALCDLGVPFCTQIGHTGPLMASEVGRPIYLDRVALDFPELVIVAGHIGYPWTD